MKFTASLAIALFSLPAFAAQFKTECRAEADHGNNMRLIYSITGTIESEREVLMKDGLTVSVRKQDTTTQAEESFLESGSLLPQPAECAEACEVMTFSVPESQSGLTVQFRASDKTISIRHMLSAKEELVANGQCTFERVTEETKAEPVDQPEKEEVKEEVKDEGAQQQQDAEQPKEEVKEEVKDEGEQQQQDAEQPKEEVKEEIKDEDAQQQQDAEQPKEEVKEEIREEPAVQPVP